MLPYWHFLFSVADRITTDNIKITTRHISICIHQRKYRLFCHRTLFKAYNIIANYSHVITHSCEFERKTKKNKKINTHFLLCEYTIVRIIYIDGVPLNLLNNALEISQYIVFL